MPIPNVLLVLIVTPLHRNRVTPEWCAPARNVQIARRGLAVHEMLSTDNTNAPAHRLIWTIEIVLSF
ncbi:hypothetical protein PAXRUDRAFT_823614 [Paxillus rubicundulus Ve08.2h10]|uniref:Uncharacterized protein n=1 Tax=Paxillus rubicundulus Ve08.2h10 TaxID=930991 RepID=A0A0D0E8P6_9AGAM|nr:hypothetical protein PAXRUDRAFT_823614 [Paxillus rubicundulus Ve08.2h10]